MRLGPLVGVTASRLLLQRPRMTFLHLPCLLARGERQDLRSAPEPPEQPALLFRQVRLAFAQLLQLRAALVFLFPVLAAVEFPVFAEIGGEGFGEEEQFDVVASRR